MIPLILLLLFNPSRSCSGWHDGVEPLLPQKVGEDDTRLDSIAIPQYYHLPCTHDTNNNTYKMHELVKMPHICLRRRDSFTGCQLVSTRMNHIIKELSGHRQVQLNLCLSCDCTIFKYASLLWVFSLRHYHCYMPNGRTPASASQARCSTASDPCTDRVVRSAVIFMPPQIWEHSLLWGQPRSHW